ncbi:hypothetical protein M8C21_007611 [Ambrosia artemisiifolia]|uniref:Peptidase S9 prolyl oligopeptidase catalytic domain-containing protein n=1 Tax=Ambrosia artemisiifolia TaxID=4212 RepID=A0AAD5GQP1_AMBAR|nr:hypothetical protein M8C21_007611 [Ambrosia artemisiifolia]
MQLHKLSLTSPTLLLRLPPSSTLFSSVHLKRCRISSSKTRNHSDNSTFSFIQSISSSRLHNLVPVAALATKDAAAGPNGSSPAPQDDELNSGYRLPPPEIRDIVDAPPLPSISFSPNRDKILFLKRRSLPPLSELAKPEDKLAGIRIDGRSNTRSRMSFYTGIGIHDLKDDGTLGPEKLIHGFPDGSKLNFVTWSTDGKHLAFSIRQDQDDDDDGSKLRVWVADVETGKAKPLFHSPDVFLNAVFDNYVWVNDSTLLVCTIPSSRGSPPKKPLVPAGPKIQSNERKNVVQARTYQDLLKDEYDEDLFEYYATSQLVLVSLDGTVKLFGEPAIYTSLDPSPDQKYVLLSSIHRPFSFNVPCGRFPVKDDLWSADGKFLRTLCDLPLAEDIPITFNSVRKGMRSLNWREDKPSDLYWVETQDGGDAKVEVSPRDIVYTQAADAPEGEEPSIFFKLDLRYGSSEDVYSDPGSPMLRRTPAGTYIIAKFKKEDREGTYLLLNGSGATPEGNIPFLDLFDVDTGHKERIWQSDKEKYYESVVALMSDQTAGDLNVNEFAILSGPTIPIIGEGKEEANDSYVEQLVWSAEAAVQEVIRRGTQESNSEDRTLWEATDTYIKMSPFMSANKIKKPILLIHGEEDNNSGTLTMQSDRFFNALKGHGALSRLVILPFESHDSLSGATIGHWLFEDTVWQTYTDAISAPENTQSIG